MTQKPALYHLHIRIPHTMASRLKTVATLQGQPLTAFVRALIAEAIKTRRSA